MLKIPNLAEEAPIVESPFTFPLDPFQKYAISAISKDENVLVTAKTGSGKTLVGEFQIWHSLKKGKRVFYTTPIKSLSNQKFHDLKQIYGDRVGIMTGDIKFCPQADVVIMTTEILRNLLFKQGTETENVGITASLSLDNLDAVVFDEVHYINDPSRGKVWEECLTLLPPSVNLVLLSATIDKPEDFANWLGDLKQKPIHLLSTKYRIVPLVHQTPDGDVIMDSKDQFHMDTYSKWYRKYYGEQDELRKHRDRVKGREEGQDVVEKTVRSYSFLDRMNKLISKMDLPALFFVFSRKLCEEYASKVTSDLLTSSQSADVRHIVKFHLRSMPELQKMSQYNTLIPLLEKGVAYHHSGLLPVLKEIIEILFSRGFVKVLFATETFAVGINMPTKTVVFTDYKKPGDDSRRMLKTSEYIQMAGRAGRRGKDDKGVVIYLPTREPVEPQLVKEMMTGKSDTVSSQLAFDYEYVLATLQSTKDVTTKSLWARQANSDIDGLEDELAKCIIPHMDEPYFTDCEMRHCLEEKFKKAVNAERQKYQKELSSWSNKRLGPKWEAAWKQYRKNIEIKTRFDHLTRKLNELKSFSNNEIRKRTDVLEKFGYVQDGSLTQKGILAAEIHEGHPLLMSYLYSSKTISQYDGLFITEILSCFLEKPHTEEYIPENPYVRHLRTHASDINSFDDSFCEPKYWEVTEYWIDVVHEWIGGNDHVCDIAGIEPGNFVRAMLKLANIIDEWVNMATIQQDVEMIEKMKDMKSKIIRGFVIPDSLYLRI
jgi:superfamily II RNA helicase